MWDSWLNISSSLLLHSHNWRLKGSFRFCHSIAFSLTFFSKHIRLVLWGILCRALILSNSFTGSGVSRILGRLFKCNIYTPTDVEGTTTAVDAKSTIPLILISSQCETTKMVHNDVKVKDDACLNKWNNDELHNIFELVDSQSFTKTLNHTKSVVFIDKPKITITSCYHNPSYASDTTTILTTPSLPPLSSATSLLIVPKPALRRYAAMSLQRRSPPTWFFITVIDYVENA
ncbi:unnamed protein product [Lactuca virosa]|uniref:Uncharacterized protein n=1 Tax=Lactuca virosa TaxID=75947 RepID=A0AAU9N3J5_9ASTR|nr:unnamed protein product [Lactuca virosa]